MASLIGIPKEIRPQERHVAATPDTAEAFAQFGFSVAIEFGACETARVRDDAYREAAVEVVDDPQELWSHGEGQYSSGAVCGRQRESR
jgi:NAD/NADP transhydrogenase alpha subunit